MKTISEELNNVQENEIINEALQEKHLMAIAKQLKADGKSFQNKVPGSFPIYRWDLVTPADVKVYNDAKRAIPDCRKIISYNEWGIIITFKDGAYTAMLDRHATVFLVSGTPFSYDASVAEKLQYIEGCDKIIIIYLEETVRDRRNISFGREQNRKDMIVRYRDELGNYYGSFKDYSDTCEKIAKENVERYKKIIEQNRALKDDDFEKISKRVNDLLQRCLQVTADMAAGKINTDGSEYRVSSILDKFYSHRSFIKGKSYGEDGILLQLNELLKAKLKLKNGNAYDIDDAKNTIEKCRTNIENLCKSVEDVLKKWLE